MNLKMLIVDDDRRFLSALSGFLTEQGYEVVPCHDGLDAIEKCREEKFDLLITDLMMPGASGLEVLKEAKKLYPDIVVILITGFASIESAIEAIREGAYDYITKPFKLEEIKIVVHNAGEKIRLTRENRRLLSELQEAYTQLRMVKRIMGAESDSERSESGNPSDPKRTEPFIAGSMLSHYYVETGPGLHPPLLSDLERISALRDRGFLTEEEFKLCKSKLLKNLQN
ncbi:MAG: sigma-54-dependent Fis family transcriptional regulator [Deltaproteobacteria bacterium]|nr:sigma-54-dependent Fis family transcriptional regulator [Deltaproteobacteria bacterium]MBW2015959.1 sigma-54-dependent Fis family transcriptional regulator [Deltaproteobacteria bacterium]MBW2129365.1 sigma-54-dependent Fis family transcriptional regulator [Deltaproteobacteria bacterium]MBW2302308.1 sigma-54-dependent Fis family transcriptional regulator [Deltaproteobacteria bacterium]